MKFYFVTVIWTIVIGVLLLCLFKSGDTIFFLTKSYIESPNRKSELPWLKKGKVSTRWSSVHFFQVSRKNPGLPSLRTTTEKYPLRHTTYKGSWIIKRFQNNFSKTRTFLQATYLHSTNRVVILQWHFILSIWTQGGHSPGWHGKTHGWGQPTGRDLEHPSSHWRHSGPAWHIARKQIP